MRYSRRSASELYSCPYIRLLIYDVSQADTVYRLGSWEYSYLFRDASDSAAYSALHYGAFALELKSHLADVMQGKSKLKYVHNV